MAVIPSFADTQLEAICRILADTAKGLTGSQIGELLQRQGIADPQPGTTKCIEMRLGMERRVLKEVDLHDGTRLVVYDVLGDETVPAADASRNVYKLDADGAVVWQIEVEAGTSARTPFTGVSRQGDRILLHRWDGIEYVVDPATGKAIPHAFIRSPVRFAALQNRPARARLPAGDRMRAAAGAGATSPG